MSWTSWLLASAIKHNQKVGNVFSPSKTRSARLWDSWRARASDLRQFDVGRGERGEVDRSDRIKLGVRDNYQSYGSLTQSVMIVSTQYLNILLGSKILNKKIIYMALCWTELFTIDDKHYNIWGHFGAGKACQTTRRWGLERLID